MIERVRERTLTLLYRAGYRLRSCVLRTLVRALLVVGWLDAAGAVLALWGRLLRNSPYWTEKYDL